MREEQFRNEKLYQATMNIARRMRDAKLISEAEYCRLDKLFLAKYRPAIGILSAEIR